MDNLKEACLKYQHFSRTTILKGYGDEIDFILGIGNELGEVLEIIQQHETLLKVVEELQILGLNAELGKVLGHKKKQKRGDFGDDILKQKLTDELGDVYWYLSNLCSLWGIDFSIDMEEFGYFDRPTNLENLFMVLDYHKSNLWNKDFRKMNGIKMLSFISAAIGQLCGLYEIDIKDVLSFNVTKLTKRFNLGEIQNHE